MSIKAIQYDIVCNGTELSQWIDDRD